MTRWGVFCSVEQLAGDVVEVEQLAGDVVEVELLAGDRIRKHDMPPPSPVPPAIPTDWFNVFSDDNPKVYKKAILIGGAGLAAFLAPLGNKTVPKVTHFLTGFEVIPRVKVVIKPLAVTWLFPEPFGLLPPEAFGIPGYTGDFKYQLRRVGFFGGLEENRRIAAEFEARTETKLQRRQETIDAITRNTRTPELAQATAQLATRDLDPNQSVLFTAFRSELVRRGFDVSGIDIVRARVVEQKQQLAPIGPADQSSNEIVRVVGPTPPPEEVDAAIAALQAIDRLFAANPPDP